MEQLEIPLRPLLVYLFVLARVGGIVTFAPFWSHRAATKTVRAALALVLALALAPAVAERVPDVPQVSAALVLVLAGELLIGCALGFAGRLVFMGLEVAAHVIGAQMGLSLAGTIDPSTNAQTQALGTAAQMLGLVVLLGMDGHHWFLAAAVRSYGSTAPAAPHVSAALAELVVRLSADALAVGVALAAPAIVVLLAVELALALAGRAAPQIQVMVLGFPIKIAVGLWLIGACVYAMPSALRATLGGVELALRRVLAAV